MLAPTQPATDVFGVEVAAEAESRDFRRVFRRQAAIVLYRTALDPQEALRRLREGAGRQFDPRVVEAFLRRLRHRGDSPQLSDLAAA
jgi:hypothetical protein